MLLPMKKLDFISILVAAMFGAALVAVVISLLNENSPDSNPTLTTLALAGLVVGAGVQTGVRLTGVS
jgi:ABC-type Fe3+-siderophore transport system permease subunit